MDLISSSTPGSHWRPRTVAAVIHLASCLAVAAVVGSLVFWLWYPGPYRAMCGGTELFTLVVGVDVALGPLITFAVFDRRKPVRELRRDMGIVVVLQIAALAYGLYTVALARPVALALEVDRFRVVSAADVRRSELVNARAEFRRLPLAGPALVATSAASSPQEKLRDIDLALHGHDLGARPARWLPWDGNARRAALAHAKPAAQLVQQRGLSGRQLQDAAGGHPVSSLAWLPIITFRGSWVALLAASTGDVVGFVPLGPG